MSQVGPIEGGAAAVLAALRTAVGPASVVVPAQTSNNSTTSPVFKRAVEGLDEAARRAYVARMPGFDRLATPSHGMGVFAECVRCQPGAVRSGHPQTSFAALGPTAESLMAVHELNCHLGEDSPLAALYRAHASVLLLGVGYDACTAFHLAEYRRVWQVFRRYECFVDDGGTRRTHTFQALDLNDRDFTELGAAFARTGSVITGRVGGAVARAFPIRAAVDFALQWMDTHRGA